MKKLTFMAAFLAASPAFAQDQDAAYELLDGIGLCMLGEGLVDKTTATLGDLGWTMEANPEAGLVDFYPTEGEATFGFMSDKVEFCQIESTVVGTDEAETMFNLFLMGGNTGITETSTGTDEMGCKTKTLSNGVVAVLTSGGNDPTCESETDSAVRFLFK